jgi:hypothetical protein
MVDGHLAPRRIGRACVVISVRHTTLPEGLSALALRDHGGNLTLFVSDAITPDRQRAAVRAALGASRRAGWRAVLIPLPIAALLIHVRAWFSAFIKACQAHAAVTAATVLAVVAVAVVVAVVPHRAAPPVSAANTPAASSQSAGPGSSASQQGSAGHSRHRNRVPRSTEPRTTASTGGSSASGRAPSPAPSPTVTPTARPTPTTSAASTPSPSPKPSSGGGPCIWLLGIRVCV